MSYHADIVTIEQDLLQLSLVARVVAGEMSDKAETRYQGGGVILFHDILQDHVCASVSDLKLRRQRQGGQGLVYVLT